MRDIIIIKTISKIHFILISAMSFIFAILSILFIVLQNGLYIDNLSLINLNAKELYIKYDEKLSIEIKELHLQTNSKNNAPFNKEEITKLIHKVVIFDSLIKKIDIQRIFYNDISGSIKYIQNKNGHIVLVSPKFIFKSSIKSKDSYLNLHIKSYRDFSTDISINGNLIFLKNKAPELISTLALSVHNSPILQIYTHSDIKKLSYRAFSINNIINSREIVDMFGFDERAKYWMYDAINMSSMKILNATGYIEYKDLENASKNIHVNAVVNDLNYTYDEKLAPIKTKYTNLEFKDGILFISPKEAYTYDFYLDKSWLKIDFSKEEEILTLILDFNGQLNKDLLHLLKRYGIEIPITQKKGNFKTNLKLVINLISSDVSALGEFHTDSAKINYMGLDIDILDTYVFIKDSNVKTNKFFAKYDDIAESYVELIYYASKSKGSLDFNLQKLQTKNETLSLMAQKKPLNVKYNISPNQDYIDIDKSDWSLHNEVVNIDQLHIPFNIATTSATIPTTSIRIKDKVELNIGGNINIKQSNIDLQASLSKFKYSDIELLKPIKSIKIEHTDVTRAISKEPIQLKYKENYLDLSSLHVKIKDNYINTANTTINMPNMLKTKLSARYNTKTNNGSLHVKSMDITTPDMGTIYKDKKTATLFFSNTSKYLLVNSKDYALKFTSNKEKHSLKLYNLEKLYESSPILKKYFLDNGQLNISYKAHSKNVDFNIDSKYRYKLLSQNNKAVEDYKLDGNFNLESSDIKLNINDKVDINVADKSIVKAKNTGIHLKQVMSFIDDFKAPKSNKPLELSLKAINSNIYFSDTRKAIFDKLDLTYKDQTLSAKIKHANAKATFALKDDSFGLYGEGFNDKFMENLFSVSRFKGGKLDFSVAGTTKEYKGIMNVDKTIIVDYKILNNILAFVNTVPSLLTFQVPGYSQSGLKANNAYISFSLKDAVYHMNDISLSSKEIDIKGSGDVSLKNNTIDVDLNLKTDLGSSVSQIPVVGHILFGKDNVSTTMSLTGKLDDPDINSELAKDIAIAPLNIIKRTLMLPFDIFND
ncbi:AsmA-like C-terminal domain-containing protein [Sulfurimonas sp.]|nr:AsmA-like C-terminal domain-containing protein [Sulfurimonas sp.]